VIPTKVTGIFSYLCTIAFDIFNIKQRMIKRYACLLFFVMNTIYLSAQNKTDEELVHLLRAHASDSLIKILDNTETYRYQLIYTQIDRNKKNKPRFTHYHYNVNRNNYFYPASTVKLPVALMALEKINHLKDYGIDKFTTMLTDSSYEGQTAVVEDSSAENGLPSVAHYVKKIFLVSDNDAYNRLYEFLGQKHMNDRLHEMGYSDMRITRRFIPLSQDQNRHTNAVRFVKNGELVYSQPPGYNTDSFDFSQIVLIGKGYYNREEKLVNEPMSFTTHNRAPLKDLREILQSVLFPETVSKKKRFKLTDEDYRFLHQYMSQYPSESSYPPYDTSKYFDSYTKFFLFRAGKKTIPDHVRIFNKTGWSYGFLTDVAYIVDFENKVEFMLSGVIYTNSDEILNDDKYEYEQIGYPFFQEVGDIIYNHELKRKRKHQPDLSKFLFDYSDKDTVPTN
jgi:hypothetical protein